MSFCVIHILNVMFVFKYLHSYFKYLSYFIYVRLFFNNILLNPNIQIPTYPTCMTVKHANTSISATLQTFQNLPTCMKRKSPFTHSLLFAQYLAHVPSPIFGWHANSSLKTRWQHAPPSLASVHVPSPLIGRLPSTSKKARSPFNADKWVNSQGEEISKYKGEEISKYKREGGFCSRKKKKGRWSSAPLWTRGWQTKKTTLIRLLKKNPLRKPCKKNYLARKHTPCASLRLCPSCSHKIHLVRH